MSRRSKLRRVRELRAFRDFILAKIEAQEMENRIMRMGVRRLDIDYGYSNQVNVNMEDNAHFYASAFWAKDALCEIGLQIYEHELSKIYPTCIKII